MATGSVTMRPMANGASAAIGTSLRAKPRAPAATAMPRRRKSGLSIVGRLDVTDDAATTGDNPALKFLGLDVKTHEHVRLDGRFDVPNRAVQIRDAVRLRPRTARRRPLAHLSSVRIEASEISARI